MLVVEVKNNREWVVIDIDGVRLRVTAKTQHDWGAKAKLVFDGPLDFRITREKLLDDEEAKR